MDQEENLRVLLDPYKSEYMPSNDVVNADVSSILGNFTEGLQMDESVRDWLSQNNVTYFVADYVPAIINLDDLIQVFYEQFPSTPAKQNASLAIIFIDDNFSNTQPFLNWLEKYQSFYQGVLDAHSRISIAINSISQAYLDSATMDSQAITQLQQDNATWAIQSLSEIMAYHKAMSTYYPSVFGSLDTIYASATNAEDCINQYNVSNSAYEGYTKQYNAIYDLATSGILPFVISMAIFGIVFPLGLLGLANWYESRLEDKKVRYTYYILIAISIFGFVVPTVLGINVLWTQIHKLFLPQF